MAKGKEHKKYEFGTKASVAMTKTHGVGLLQGTWLQSICLNFYSPVRYDSLARK